MKTKRGLISEALETELKKISVVNGFNTDLYENVKARFIFPDEDPELPLVCFTCGSETINYQPGGFQDRYLSISLRCYIESQDDPVEVIEKLIQDIETTVENSSRLLLSDGSTIRDMRVLLIDTDQGILAPLGLAEIQLIVEY